jgi:3'5'-cyclic nucleotide phosphodiesterase
VRNQNERCVRRADLYPTVVLPIAKDNEFHNFEHATHVLMSVMKLLGRVSTSTEKKDRDHSFQFDPLIQFGCVLAALIHDIDHQGVTNIQLVNEKTALAARYSNKAVAEQNSIDIGWALFMADKFSAFRKTVCPTNHHLQRLRQLVVNSVIATDIMDPDLKESRNSRWEKAFGECHQSSDQGSHDIVNRKATLVLEHLIQASDVSHCMQHWQVYRKWNERLFREMYHAYDNGRGASDPSEFWYQGELGFFDFYIIPLAKKLRDCEVFGVSSDEFLNYAEQNREEWQSRGEEIVSQMKSRVRLRRLDRI